MNGCPTTGVVKADYRRISHDDHRPVVVTERPPCWFWVREVRGLRMNGATLATQ